MNAKERILQFIDFKGISKREFYLNTGLSNGFLDKVFNIGSDKLEIILSKYSEINPAWLLTGKGIMLLDFGKGITGGENPVIDEEFKNIKTNFALLDKLVLSNKKAHIVESSFSDIYGNIMLLKEFLYQYDIHNKMIGVLECYEQKKVGIEDVIEEFKANFSVLEELHSIIEPYKTIIYELFTKVSDFNDKHDRLYSMEDEKEL
jgi:hypothetical protein